MSAWEKFKDFFMRDDGGELVYVDEVEDEVEEAQPFPCLQEFQSSRGCSETVARSTL